MEPYDLSTLPTGERVITEHIPLERVLDAFAIVQDGKAIKVTVEP